MVTPLRSTNSATGFLYASQIPLITDVVRLRRGTYDWSPSRRRGHQVSIIADIIADGAASEPPRRPRYPRAGERAEGLPVPRANAEPVRHRDVQGAPDQTVTVRGFFGCRVTLTTKPMVTMNLNPGIEWAAGACVLAMFVLRVYKGALQAVRETLETAEDVRRWREVTPLCLQQALDASHPRLDQVAEAALRHHLADPTGRRLARQIPPHPGDGVVR